MTIFSTPDEFGPVPVGSKLRVSARILDKPAAVVEAVVRYVA